MSRHYQRLFEAAVFENGLSNPRHLSNDEYLALARAAALRGARRNGVAASRVTVDFPAGGFAPTRIEVSTSGEAQLRLGERRTRDPIPVKAVATAEIAPDLNVAFGSPPTAREAGTPARWPTGWASPLVICFPLRSAVLKGSIQLNFRTPLSAASHLIAPRGRASSERSIADGWTRSRTEARVW